MKTSKSLAIAMAALLLSACSKNDEVIDGGLNKGEGAVVNILLENGAKGSTTRETDPGSAAESKVSTLEFFIFDSNGDKDSQTPYFALGAYQYKTTINIACSGNVRFVVVANASIGSAMATYGDLQAKLAGREFTAGETALDHNARTIPAGGFEMSGETVSVITGGSAENSVTVGLDRLVSKFGQPTFTSAATGFLNLPDIDLAEVWGAGTTVTNDDMEFAFNGYALVNGVNKSLLLNRIDWNNSSATPATTWEEEWVNWYDANETSQSLKYLGSNFDASGKYTNNYSGKNSNGSWFIEDTNPVYVYENSPAIITANVGKGYDSQKVYAFIVEGTLTANAGTSDEQTATRYWRVNLIPESDYHIYRNKSYRVSITSIKSAGYATPEEAEKNDPIVPVDGETYVDVMVIVNPWDVIVSSTQM